MKNKYFLKRMTVVMILSACHVSNAQDKLKIFGRTLSIDTAEVKKCSTTEYEEGLQKQNPKRASTAQFEDWLAKKIQEGVDKRSSKSGHGIMTIPVVIHVIHDGDAIGQNENISDALIQKQIRILNEDFSAEDGTPGENVTGYGGDTKIRFCLAMIDPNGQPTNGINRYNNGNKQYSTEAEIEQMKPYTQWDPERYLNIWVVNWTFAPIPGAVVAGYAQFPTYNMPGITGHGGYDDTDGVAILTQYFGKEGGRTLTHEIGHFLGLRHIWGDKQNSCIGEDDYCNDTPVAAEANSGCFYNDSCPYDQRPDMIENYMDYTDSACQSVFTPDQANRMKMVLQNAPRRANLLTSNVCGTASSQEFQFLMGVNVHPNPTQNELNLSIASENLPDSYSVYNIVGQLIINVIPVTQGTLSINTSAYANGVYFIKIVKGPESTTIKFIKN